MIKGERRKFNKFRGSIAEKEQKAEREGRERKGKRAKRKSTRTHMSEFVVERRKATHKKYENVAQKH